MATMRRCPVCSNMVDADLHVCDRCGFRLVGNTESFEVVNGEGRRTDDALVGSVAYGFPTLTVVKGPLKDEVFHLDRMPIVIGRDPSCDLFLNNMTVSRKHAIIDEEDGQIIIRDYNSMNGTWIDGEIIDQAVLEDGSMVQVGTFAMTFSSKE